MEMTFSQLRAKEVIKTQDGRRLGRINDIVLCYPDNRWLGFVVPGGRGFGKKNDLFIELKNIVKIGEDVILVNVGFPRKQNCDKHGHGMPIPPAQGNFRGSAENNGRNFEEYE